MPAENHVVEIAPSKVIARLSELLAIVLGVGRSLTSEEAAEGKGISAELRDFQETLQSRHLNESEDARRVEISKRTVELREIRTGRPRELTKEEDAERLSLLDIFWEFHMPPCTAEDVRHWKKPISVRDATLSITGLTLRVFRSKK